MIEAPKGGTNIVIGIGLYTNGINPRAVAAKWMAGADSLMNDVRFLGGHGTSRIDGGRENPYNNTHTADPDLNRRWDGQYPSLWVTDGGGGTFFDIWTPSTFAQAGHAGLQHLHRGPHLPDVERAPRAQRGADAQRLQLAHLRAADRRGARRGRLRAAAGDRRLQQHHGRELSHLPRDQHLPAVSVRHQGLELEGTSASATSTATATARCRSTTRSTTRRTTRAAAARVRLADAFGQRAGAASRKRLAGTGGRREGGEAGGRLLQHLRRRGGPGGRLLLRGRALAAHLSMVGRVAPALDRARQSARPRQPGVRQGRQPDGGVVRRRRHGLHLQAGSAGSRHHAIEARSPPRRGPA